MSLTDILQVTAGIAVSIPILKELGKQYIQYTEKLNNFYNKHPELDGCRISEENEGEK